MLSKSQKGTSRCGVIQQKVDANGHEQHQQARMESESGVERGL